jgi:hypothetical protein
LPGGRSFDFYREHFPGTEVPGLPIAELLSRLSGDRRRLYLLFLGSLSKQKLCQPRPGASLLDLLGAAVLLCLQFPGLRADQFYKF